MRLSSCFLAFTVCLGPLFAQPTLPDFVRGVKVYEPQKDRAASFQAWKEMGLNTIWIGGDLAKDPTFFKDARAAGFKTQVVFPVFYNPEALAKDPTLWAIQGNGKRAKDDWVEFVCPSRPDHRKARIAEARRVLRELKPDGLSLDFIRHFIFWETKFPDTVLDPMATTCFCDHCLAAFQKEKGVALPKDLTGTPAKAAWILANAKEAWADWKSGLITSMVAELAKAARAEKPDVWVNLHAAPYREQDYNGARRHVVGQDLKALGAHVDTLSPMVYAPMVKQTSAWVHEVTEDMAKACGKPVLPSIQVDKAYLPDPVTPTRFKADYDAAVAKPSRGVVFWNWNGLAVSAEKRSLVK